MVSANRTARLSAQQSFKQGAANDFSEPIPEVLWSKHSQVQQHYRQWPSAVPQKDKPTFIQSAANFGTTKPEPQTEPTLKYRAHRATTLGRS